jgi:hypothetical protein
MKRQLITAALLAATGALAAPSPTPLALTGGPDNFTATLRVNHSAAGPFVDEFFIAFGGWGVLNSQLTSTVSTSYLATNQILFTDVDLDDFDFTITSRFGATTSTHIARLTNVLADGGFLLRVEGCAGACDGSPSYQNRISASYSGTVNVMRTAAPTQNVPEPATLALTLAALGAAALARRRR